jgi:hypothetical protein
MSSFQLLASGPALFLLVGLLVLVVGPAFWRAFGP